MKTETISNLGATALTYATELGWHVFPVFGVDSNGRCLCGGTPGCNGGKAAGKHPVPTRGHLAATTDAKIIGEWWREHPDANIGVAAKPSGLAVVDRDPRNGSDETWRRLTADHGDLGSPVRAATGGGGFHDLFKAPPGDWTPLAAHARPGVDLKIDGYFVAPPSRHRSGAGYTWAPGADPFTAAILGELPNLPMAFREGARSEIITAGERLGLAPEAAAQALADLDFDRWGDDRDGWMRVGMALHHEFQGSDDGLKVWNDWAAASSKFDPKDSARVWKSFRVKATPVTMAAIVAAGFANRVDRLFDDEPETVDEASPSPAARLTAKPLTWVDPASLPRRQWLYGRSFIRRFVSATVAAGGSGKSALLVSEALAMATGRDLLGDGPAGGPLTVWSINLEDPAEEMQRRFIAAAQHFNISESDVTGRLFVGGRESNLVLAREGQRGGAVVVEPMVANLISEIRKNGVDVLIVDPFVSSHAVSENDNRAIDLVAKAWARIADETGAAVHLVHHVRKASFGQAETGADDARGASALVSAARSVRALNRLSAEDAKRFGIGAESRWRYLRVDDAKANLAPPAARAVWRRLVSVGLGNGDDATQDFVGVAAPWSPPDLVEDFGEAGLTAARKALETGGPWREDVRSTAWAGRPIAAALGLNLEFADDRARVRELIARWVEAGDLQVREMRGDDRKMRAFIVPGLTRKDFD